MDFYYFQSPHKQVFEDFPCEVIKVTDGDTVRVQWSERDFPFTVRLADIDAPEKGTSGHKESGSWLADQILGKKIEMQIDRDNRIDKWGRLLGTIIYRGVNINEVSTEIGHSKAFGS